MLSDTFDVKNINKMQKDWFFSGFGPVFLKTGCNRFGPVFKRSMNHSQASKSGPVRSSSKKGKKTGLDWTFKLYLRYMGSSTKITTLPVCQLCCLTG